MGKLQEKVQANHVNAPVLFVGCGGIGSKIIKGVADRALHDDNSNLRFVIMDTDVNDISSVDKGANIVAIQTSSTATIENYLKNDQQAKNKWFPVNKMLDPKPVSEGAGQVRAISRLALNATIKQGNIQKLYKTIDDLFLKDGGKFKQAIKVVIASTAAGGTGSGIAMEVGMLVRHYVKKNYPEAAAMIRGFLVMPGVMDTVIDSQSEKDSIRCNGYATIKEINAFMMKGSGFFDTVPELHRYHDLCITVPNSASGEEKLSCLPFDFCFLLDRADSNAGIMPTMGQYINNAAQAIYEQNIGPMSTKSSSKEDNVLKLCIHPDSLGRCRFGGAGASKLIYPYEKVRDYIALNWARSAIIGTSPNKNLSEEEKAELMQNSWLQYDMAYKDELKKYEDNPAISDKPERSDVYVRLLLQGKDTESGNAFSSNLWNRYILAKVLETKYAEGGKPTIDSADTENLLTERVLSNSATEKVARNYFSVILNKIITEKMDIYYSGFSDDYEGMYATCVKGVAGATHINKYKSIESIADVAMGNEAKKAAEDIANAIFSNKASSANNLGEHMLESYISVNDKVMHPNAVRFMLYELKKFVENSMLVFTSGSSDNTFRINMNRICFGDNNDGTKNVDIFNVPGLKAKGKETNLQMMCLACDKIGSFGEGYGASCEDMLADLSKIVDDFLINKLGYYVCKIASPALDNLIKAFEQFYGTFESKVPSLDKKKEDIVTSLKFHEGDYIWNLFKDKEVLDRLADMNATPTESGSDTAELYAKIYDNVRANAYVIAKQKYNPYEFVTKKDIFFDVIVPYFSRMVEEGVEDINVDNVLCAAKLEAKIKNNIAVENTTPSQREDKKKLLDNDSFYAKYIKDTIDRCVNLSSPGIFNSEQVEPREVSSIAYSSALEDGDGIRISDFLKDQVATDTVSAYELHFFRSVYNITPVQLSKLSAPEKSEDGSRDLFNSTEKDDADASKAGGDYFRIYQKYMDTIGPDSKTSAVITPHIDQRWNSISILPELDMEYQRTLMSTIHKSLVYGFVYDRIRLRGISDDDPNQKVYIYFDNDEVKQEMKVSNGTKCDELYEVLDCLYFDRKAVSTIRTFVNAIRTKVRDKGCKTIEESDFFKELSKLRRKNVINLKGQDENDSQISLFELVLLYCNSLPAPDKDENELRIMIDSIIDILYAEISCVINNVDTRKFRVAEVLIKQYEMFVEGYKKHKSILRIGLFSDEVIEITQSALIKFFKVNDLPKYVEKIRNIIID